MAIATHAEVLARFGHALSDPTRSRVLLVLRDGPAYPAELAEVGEEGLHVDAKLFVGAVDGGPGLRFSAESWAAGPGEDWADDVVAEGEQGGNGPRG